MKTRLLDHLVCPLDRTPLELRAWTSEERHLTSAERSRAESMGIDPRSLEHDVFTGVLINSQRKLLYPIHAGVPRMLTFRSGVADSFATQNATRLRDEFSGYILPSEEAMPGEADVLRTFSSEWLNYDWDGKAYWNLTADAWFDCMDYALEMNSPAPPGRLCLEVGIGIGGVANHMAQDHGCEQIGIDLGYSVDAANKHFGKNPFLHIVQASVFRPPFAEKTFDFVYSFGVIHHTFSTQTAFQTLAKLPKPGGRLFIWVYSPFNESRSLQRKALMLAERVARPILWRLPESLQAVALMPVVPLYMGMQWWRSRASNGEVVPYGFREAMHAARDRFTPPYVHRHSEEEVSDWFSKAGYEQLLTGSKRERPETLPIGFWANTAVRGVRTTI